jgi:Beta-galactosidase
MKAGLCLLAAACSLVVAASASASSSIRFGIQDDAWLLYGPGSMDDRVETIDRLGLDVVRLTLEWHLIEQRRGEYDWQRADALLEALRKRGIGAVVTIWGTPRWANGGASPNWAPRSAADIERFARAAASRYRFVRSWLVWNEPNQRRWLRPVSATVYVSRLLNPAYRGIKSVNPGARVGGGVTAPRGGAQGVSPVEFIRVMARAGAQLDAYAHHPYPLSRGDTPLTGGCRHCETITMSTIDRLVREVGRAFPGARVWLTEYGYQTNPPDGILGVSPARQARYIGEASFKARTAAKIDMLVHYLYRDEPDLGRWQSGLETIAGRMKPGYWATMLPLAQVSREGATTRVWGQVRPGKGAQEYVLQQLRGDAWRSVGGIRSTSARGYLERELRAGKGSRLRLWYPAQRAASPPLVVH